MIKPILLLLLCIGLFNDAIQAQYNIQVKIDNYENDTLILGYRLGKKTYVRDTTIRNKKGHFVFSGSESMNGGVYLVLIKPQNTYFEFLVPDEEDQKSMQISTKLLNGNDMNTHLKITGSEENQIFLDYLSFLRDMRKKDTELSTSISSEKNEVKKKSLQMEREGLSKQVGDYQKNMIDQNKGRLCANLIQASQRPVIPENIRSDRAKAFYWYRDHFWDNVDLADHRLIRTPILEEKLNEYIGKLLVQAPDSIIQGLDVLISKIEKGGNEKMFQYVAAEMLNKYAKSKVICMDAVYVHLGEKYYCSGKADWVDSAQLAKICENVQSLKPLRCGEFAPNIRLKKMNGEVINLYELKNEFTAVYFWDPTCGNCSKVSAKLVPVYEKYKEYGFEVFGICSKTWKELDQCKKKIEDKKMNWINTSDDAYPLAVVKKQYDIKVNPYILLLDKDKRIMFKRIDPGQVDDILKREFEKKGVSFPEEETINKLKEEQKP